MKKALILLLTALVTVGAFAQKSKSDILNVNNEITWLGIDFTQLRFIGNASQFKDAGDITTSTLKNRYFPGWNQLFVNEQNKFNVAGATNRTDVRYAMEVTESANNEIKGDLFSSNPNDFTRLNKEFIEQMIKNYDFKGNKGIGLMFVAETMSKGREQAAIWVVFIDMDTKKVILAERTISQARGIGFKNYWANTFYESLKTTRSSLKRWCKN
ncbi:MAG: hypothetical protein ACK40G_00050 [Cytophagaceae bacterium]